MDAASSEDILGQRELLGRLADRLTERRLNAPALLFLETVKPLSFIASQSLVFLEPLLQPLLGWDEYRQFSEAVESRENLEWLIARLEDQPDPDTQAS